MNVIRSTLFLIILCAPLLSFSKTESNIQLRKLAEGVWMQTSAYTYPNGVEFPSNGLVVKQGDELILIDTAWGELKTVELLHVIKQEINLPISKAIVTHAHSDRAAGVDVLEAQGIEVYSLPLTQRLTIEHGLPVPNKTLKFLDEPGSTTQFGKLEVLFPGPAHAMDNLMVWLPAHKILFGGCALRSTAATGAGNTSHGDVESWIKVMALISERYRNATIVVPGHGEPGGVELIKHTLELVRASR